jgi:type IV fimbrial biogenesis protein FimT
MLVKMKPLRKSMNNHTGREQPGFTLVEFMVVVAVIAVLVTYAIPSFTDLITRSRIVASINHFVAGNTFARSEAISRKVNVGIAPATGTDWATGWVVFIDSNFDNVFNAGEVTLARGDPLPEGLTVTDNAGAPGSALVYVPGGTLRFNGAALGQRRLDMELKNQKRVLCVAATGSIRQPPVGTVTC